MRAKILFLAETPEDREQARPAQLALSELALAFSHSFTMREYSPKEGMGAEEWQALVADADAVLVTGKREFVEGAARKLGCFAILSGQEWPQAAEGLSRLKQGAPPVMPLIWPIGKAAGLAGKTTVSACAFARQLGRPLAFIESEETEGWQALLAQASRYAAMPLPEALSLDAYLDLALMGGGEVPLAMAARDSAAFVSRLGHYLGGTELLAHETGLHDHGRVHLVHQAGARATLPLYALLFATAALVRDSLKLEREADCMDAAVGNVLASGCRTPEFGLSADTVSVEEATQRVCRQIELAGELIERFS